MTEIESNHTSPQEEGLTEAAANTQREFRVTTKEKSSKTTETTAAE